MNTASIENHENNEINEVKVSIDYWNAKYTPAEGEKAVVISDSMDESQFHEVLKELTKAGGVDYLDDSNEGHWYVGWCKDTISVWVREGEVQFLALKELVKHILDDLKK